ncbi:MAG TPA: hypothetical protein H9811_05100 [Candidatus Gemmiger excrementigallinarum]|uniref:Poly(3-hydroxybutyrate) depolymerase n=1 Tax=Candidatus Gemmiger excrementigallinarum TaxID=2838609 RepID=A0A9D2EQD7_9FIRM|nr:hypothetical protein [Candidatus Gemmiger excrementigallinarum]
MSLRLQAGSPNDANREYVPLGIKGTDMTVNENGNNSQVYPARLRECTGVLADGLEDRWYEYIPTSYDGSRPVPLVVSNHGGMMNGWAQAVYSSWTLLAEREGFICVFPDCHELQMWTIQGMQARVRANPQLVLPLPVDPEDYHDNHDLNYVKALIGRMQETYNIDPGRIYMQGMSMGHMMTDQFARYYGNLLAGAAGSGASAVDSQLYNDDGSLRNWGGPVPMWISHPEKNGMDNSPEAENADQKGGREYWMKVNGVHTPPRIRIVGEDNFAFYTGDKADLVFLDIKNRDHGQALDEAFYYWNYLFSGVRRAPDGTLVRQPSRLAPEGDRFALALTPGTRKAWFHNTTTEMPVAPLWWQKLKYHGLEGGQLVRGEYLCVSLRFLAEVFGASYTTDETGLEATLQLADGRTVKISRGVIGCLVDDDLYAMYCEALHREGELMVSVEWFCRFLFNLHVSVCNGVVYATDHFAELSTFMAEILKEQLL